MKNQLFALIGMGLLLASISASAQTVALKAKIPFNFVVTGRTIPAGEYAIQSVDKQGVMLSIRDADLRPTSMVISHRCESLNRSAQTKLVFHRYGTRYFLAQICGREINRVTNCLRATTRPKLHRTTSLKMWFWLRHCVSCIDLTKEPRRLPS